MSSAPHPTFGDDVSFRQLKMQSMVAAMAMKELEQERLARSQQQLELNCYRDQAVPGQVSSPVASGDTVASLRLQLLQSESERRSLVLSLKECERYSSGTLNLTVKSYSEEVRHPAAQHLYLS